MRKMIMQLDVWQKLDGLVACNLKKRSIAPAISTNSMKWRVEACSGERDAFLEQPVPHDAYTRSLLKLSATRGVKDGPFLPWEGNQGVAKRNVCNALAFRKKRMSKRKL
jgi:hypothetical protein